MVALTDADIQQVIIDEVGDTPDGLLAGRIATYWASYADKTGIYPRLQELYTQRRCIDAVRGAGGLRNQTDFSMSGDLSLHLSDRMEFLAMMRKEVCAEIAKLELWAQAGRAGVVKELVNTEIEPPPPLSPPPPIPPDSNAEWYRGSPYFNLRGQRTA